MSTRVVPLKPSGMKDEFYDKLLDDDEEPPKYTNKQWTCIFIVATTFIIIIGVAILILVLVLSEPIQYPVIAATWQNFGFAVDVGWNDIMNNDDSLSACIEVATAAEEDFAILNVGPGGKPDSKGVVTLDALVMYGPSHDTGAVGALKNIVTAAKAALGVMLYTQHTLLVGDEATEFARNLFNINSQDPLFSNFNFTNISDVGISQQQYSDWINDDCQPTFIRNFADSDVCDASQPRPYSRDMYTNPNWNDGPNINDTGSNKFKISNNNRKRTGINNHDTIGVISIDSKGYQSITVSTNGLTHKIAGRVGDSPIPGSGGYVEQGVGAAVATGNGDVMMRFCPAKTAVLYMKLGRNVQTACDEAIKEMLDYYPNVGVALLCMDKDGKTAGSSSYNDDNFGYVKRTKNDDSTQTYNIKKIEYDPSGTEWNPAR